MGVFPFNQVGIEKLELLIPNRDLTGYTTGANIPILNSGSNEPGFIIIGGWVKCINGTSDLAFTGKSAYITTRDFTPNIICVYIDPRTSLRISPDFGFVFLTAYDISAPDFPPPSSFKTLDLDFDGDYFSGDGDLQVVLYGNYI